MGSAVSCMETAGEGGPYGMALLASYMLRGQGESLGDYLENRVFRDSVRTSTQPDAATAAGFESYLARYKIALTAEKSAAELV